MESNPSFSYQIVSIIAFLIGVPSEYFESGRYLSSIYEELSDDPYAVILRNLCRVRTSFMRNYDKISAEIVYDIKSIDRLSPGLIPNDSIQSLRKAGMELSKANAKPESYLPRINRYISENIGTCKHLFPLWIQWEYIKDLFLMPDGQKVQRTLKVMQTYRASINIYPFHCYVNIPLRENGNIILNDEKFVRLLYGFHNDRFSDLYKLRDISEESKNALADFFERHEKVAIVVDCENSNPYKLYDALYNIKKNYSQLATHVVRVMLFDDQHTTNAWRWLSGFLSFPTEHIDVKRINERKSLVDQCLSAAIQTEYYENKITGFVLASSDSDYWGLISYSKADFLILAEESKTGSGLKDALRSARIHYCYLDDFATGESRFKDLALKTMVNNYLTESVSLNVEEMMEQIFEDAFMPLTKNEQRMYYEKILKQLRISIEDDGELRIIYS